MISVVVPLYNKEKSVASTLQSVYEQTYKNYEVVIVNDGSTDNSANVVKDFIAHIDVKYIDNRWTIIEKPNGGVSSARNAGIMEAKGEYVAFLDADDLWAPNYLKTLAALIRDYPDAGLYSIGYEEIDTGTIPQSMQTTETPYRGEANPWTHRIKLWAGSSCCSRRDRLIKVGLFDTRMTHGEDIDMWWRLILDGGIVVDTKCCAYYRQDTENRAMNKTIPLEKHIPYYIDKYAYARETNEEFRRFFDEQMIYRLYPYMFTRQYRKEARRLAKKLDYTQLKGTMHFRMLFPHIYRIYQKLTGKV